MTQQHFNIVLPGFELAADNSNPGESRWKVGFVSNVHTNTVMVSALLEGRTVKEIQDVASGRDVFVDGPISNPLVAAFSRIVGATAKSLSINAPRENAYVTVFKIHD